MRGRIGGGEGGCLKGEGEDGMMTRPREALRGLTPERAATEEPKQATERCACKPKVREGERSFWA